MAEGGDENKDNPFSFKKFMAREGKKGGTSASENQTQDNDLDILPDVSRQSRSREKATLKVVNDTQDNTAPTKSNKKGKDENPFSFKKFLEAGGTSKSKATGSSRLHVSSRNENGNPIQPLPQQDSLSPTFRPMSSDFASGLPDFVQDHFSDLSRNRSLSNQSDKSNEAPALHGGSLNLPDFTFSSSNDPSRRREDHDDEDDDFSEDAHASVSRDNDAVISGKSSCSLPDFLPESVQSNGLEAFSRLQGGVESPDGETASVTSGELNHEILMLRQENRRLQKLLKEARDEAVMETQRCHKMQRDMEAQQKKEAEETAALENMVQQVEANLTITTKRAVTAENQVKKLQSEIKTLRSQFSMLKGENDLLRSSDHGVSDMHERMSYVSQQLAQTAAAAEQNLRQMLDGVQHLKLSSQILSSAGKVTEETSDQSQSEKPQQRDPKPQSVKSEDGKKRDNNKPNTSRHRKEQTNSKLKERDRTTPTDV